VFRGDGSREDLRRRLKTAFSIVTAGKVRLNSRSVGRVWGEADGGESLRGYQRHGDISREEDRRDTIV